MPYRTWFSLLQIFFLPSCSFVHIVSKRPEQRRIQRHCEITLKLARGCWDRNTSYARRYTSVRQELKRGKYVVYPSLLKVWYRPESSPATAKTGPGKVAETSDGIWWRTDGPVHGISERNDRSTIANHWKATHVAHIRTRIAWEEWRRLSVLSSRHDCSETQDFRFIEAASEDTSHFPRHREKNEWTVYQ